MFPQMVLMSFFFWMCSVSTMYSQGTSSLSIDQAYLIIEVDTGYQSALSAAIRTNQLDSIPFSVKVVVHCSDTADIDSMHFRVGRSLGGQDVANVNFAYHSSALPAGLQTFARMEDGFQTCVATHVLDAYTLYLEVWADDKLGNTTPIYRKQIN